MVPKSDTTNNNVNFQRELSLQSSSSLSSSVDNDESPSSSDTTNTSNDGFYFLSIDARRQLPLYQYRGCDKSLLYHYVLSPFATFCVNQLTPKTIAPNAITLTGLLFMLISYLIFWYYVPTIGIEEEEEEQEQQQESTTTSTTTTSIPQWIFLYNCLAMLIYQTLDNMDGKQARKTKSSSPLGLLFDHGCDAINSIFGSINWIICMGLNPISDPLLCFIVIFGPYSMFYVATWEEYYTNELILPIINGPNEGLFGGAMLSLTTYLYGISYWQSTTWYETTIQQYNNYISSSSTTTIIYSSSSYVSSLLSSLSLLRNCDILVYISGILMVQEIIFKSKYVIRLYGIQSLFGLIPLFILCSSYFIIGIIDPTIFNEMPRTAIHLSMLLFVEMSTDIMLSHITKQSFQYNIFSFSNNNNRFVLLPLVLYTVLTCLVPLLLQQQQNILLNDDDKEEGNNNNMIETIMTIIITSVMKLLSMKKDWLVAYTWSLGTYLTFKIILVIHEICSVLNIWCFDIVTKRTQQQRRQPQKQQVTTAATTTTTTTTIVSNCRKKQN